MKSWRSLIPNLLTLANLASGILAILAIFSGEFIDAAWLMVASLFFDFLDGMAARALGVGSELGLQLDSLADLISFGLAPGFLMYHHIARLVVAHPNLGWVPYLALAIPLLSAYRLAMFNIDERQTTYFIGLPTPANAIFIYAVVLFDQYAENPVLLAFFQNPIALSGIALIFSILLISPIPLQSFKVKEWSVRANLGRLMIIISSLLLWAILGWQGLVFIIPLYLVTSLIFKPAEA